RLQADHPSRRSVRFEPDRLDCSVTPMADRKSIQPSSLPASNRLRSPDDLSEHIVVVRGHRVMLDVDLATIYGVAPKRLNEQVKSNRARFPEDYLFQLTLDDAQAIPASRSHIATLNRGHNVK